MIQPVLCSLLFFLFTLNSVFAQSRFLDKAQEHYQLNEYAEAIPILKKELKKHEDNYRANKLLANTYHKLRKFDQAELYYAQATQLSEAKAEDFFAYGQVLMSQSKPQEAIRNFSTYIEKGGSSFLGEMMKESASRIEEIDTLTNKFIIDSLRAINSSYSDFGIQFFKDNFYISSNRTENFYSPEDAAWIGGDFFNVLEGGTGDIFKAKSLKLKEVKGKVNTFYHDGPIAIDEHSGKAALIRIDNKMKGKDFVNQMKLYIGEYKKGKWRDFSPFPYNKDEYSIGQAAFADSGKTLYFSSDMPGGYGGMDLYVSYLKDGVWTMPKNLGSGVNTPLNEVYPFYYNKRLYFSSDGHTNYGGLDIFQAEIKYGQWARPRNLLKPINSNADDFSFYLSDQKSGFFASNREGGLGEDDIFYFEQRPEENVKLHALFEYNGLPQENVKASLINSEDSTLEVAYSDSEGNFIFENLPYNEDYMIKLETEDQTVLKEGRFFIVDDAGNKQMLLEQTTNGAYAFKSLPVDELKEMNRLMATDNNSLIEVEEYVQGSIYKKLPGDLNDQMTVYALNEYGEIIDSVLTDEDGNFSFTSLPSDENYLFKLSEDEPDLMLALVNQDDRMVQNLSSEEGYYKLNQSIDASKNEDLARNTGSTTLLAKLFKENESVPEKWVKIYDKDYNLITTLLTNQKGALQFNDLQFDDSYFLEIQSEEESDATELHDIAVVNLEGDPLYLLERLKNGLFELKTLPFDEWQELEPIDLIDPRAEVFIFKGQVFEKLPGDISSPQVVYVVDESGEIIDSTLTNAKGIFTFSKLDTDESYSFRVKGKGEGVNLVQLDKNELILQEADLNPIGDFEFNKLKTDEVAMVQMETTDDIEPVEYTVLSGLVFNKLPGDYGSGIEVNVYNEKGELVGTTYTDEDGRFSFNKLDADGNYFYQINDVEDDVQLVTYNVNDEPVKRKLDEEFSYSLLKGNKNDIELIDSQDETYLIVDEEHKDLKNFRLYYLFDHFDLEDREINKLDELIQLLKATNQSIQLVSHTDIRGSDEYNMKLSKKRAEFVERYLIENGISKDRIHSDYRGESEPYIDCETTDCDAAKHRLNRRTEFKVLLSN
ncbi:MAG: OmpA family protein [Vicingaceae bacterium]